MADCPSEDTLLALSRGGLAGEVLDQVMEHLDRCEICRKVAAALAADTPLAGEAAMIGRYQLLEPIGAGAMGVVFAAYDPELDRKVAVKVLRRDRGGDGGRVLEQRLVGEARALAKLAHPNVIAAYEVGRHDGEVFLAMEMVTGSTLTHWLAAEPRPRREVIAAFLQAGLGLAAAHDAGIIHRDFKPDNVLVGDDGRLRVTDFGLASGGLSSGASPSGVLDEVALTRTGALAGTPAYMAPEQLEGASASPRSDQFAFAVALWAALYGVRPFAGATVPALALSARAGRLRVLPERDVPAGLRRVLTRALAADPAARWPELRALLEALAPYARPTATRRRIATAAVLAIVLSGGVGLGLTQRPTAPSCDIGAAAASIWDADHRAAVEHAFTAVAPGSTSAIITAIDSALTGYRDAWASARDEACRLGAAAPGRTACLDLQRLEVDALVRLFRAADTGIVDSAIGAVGAMPDPAACARNRVAAPVSSDPATVAQTSALVGRLAEVKALRLTGRFQAAADGAEAVRRDADAAGLAGVRNRAVLEAANARDWVQVDRAVVDYHDVIERGLIEHDDELLVDALLGLTFSHVRSGHHEPGALAAVLTAAAIERIGGDPERESGLAQALCLRAWRVGKDLAAGRMICEDARRKIIADGGADDFRLVELETETGNLAFLQGRYDDAIGHYRAAITGFTRLYGPDNPRTDPPLGNIAEAMVRLGRGAEAVAIYERLVARTPDSAAFFDGLAQARRQGGDHAGALAAHQQAAVLGARTGFAQDRCWGEVGTVEDLIALARFTEVPVALTRAQAACDHAGMPVDRARVEFARAKLRDHAGDHRGASAAARSAVALATEAGDAAGPGAELKTVIEAWQRTHQAH